jgi:hypothetical protein
MSNISGEIKNLELFPSDSEGSKADAKKLAYVGSKPGVVAVRDSDSWFTPSRYTKMACEVMGGIELDPFSSKIANRSVQAQRYFSIEDDAFRVDWQKEGRNISSLWMNPPYGRGLINASVNTFIYYWDLGVIENAVVLVNNATETTWFQKLANRSCAICLPDKRIAFENFDGKSDKSGNTRGQIFLYFGQEVKCFRGVFSKIGVIMTPCLD